MTTATEVEHFELAVRETVGKGMLNDAGGNLPM